MSSVETFEVVIVGAGASGIAAAVALQRAGIEDYLILEAADDFGGTWRANTYPGCACDVPSALYSYSFEPNAQWSRLFAGQGEILRYLRQVAAKHGLAQRTRFHHAMTKAQWDEPEARWQISTPHGEVRARFLIAAAGPWNEPVIPAIPGLEDFPGPVFHSARWQHDVDLFGQRVAVIGSGASAVQFVPRIQPDVAELHLFQRTAQWVLPKADVPMPRLARLALSVTPLPMRGLRALQYGLMETLGLGFRHPSLMAAINAVGTAYLRAVVADPDLRAKLTPDFTAGCKRLLFSNDYLQSLTRSNVSVHATAVDRIEGNVLIGADGAEVEADVVLLGTGFALLEMPLANLVFDGQGRSLAEFWQGSPEAYLGTAISGFPNAFTLLGPNLGTGHSSAFAIIEPQVDLVVQAIKHTRQQGYDWIVVRPEAQDRFNAEVQERLPGTVYNAGGCRSYYLDRNGRNSFIWPWSTGTLNRRLRGFQADDFIMGRLRERSKARRG